MTNSDDERTPLIAAAIPAATAPVASGSRPYGAATLHPDDDVPTATGLHADRELPTTD